MMMIAYKSEVLQVHEHQRSTLGGSILNKTMTHLGTHGDSTVSTQNNTLWHTWGLIQLQAYKIKL